MNLFYAIWLLITGMAALMVAWAGWNRRAAPGALALVALTLAMAVWSLMYALFWLSVSETARDFWLNMTYFGVAVAPVAFFILVCQFIGQDGWLNRRAYILLSIIPAITLLLLWTDPMHGLFFGGRREAGQSVIFSGGAWWYVFVVYSYSLLLISTILLLRAYMRSSPLYRRQTRVMLAGALLPGAANLLMLSGLHPLPGLDLTPMAFTGTSLLFAYGFLGYRMMDLVPVGRDVLVENMEDAILVVDMQERILDINPKAMEFADPEAGSPIGKPLRQVFSRWADRIPDYSAFEGRFEAKLDRPPYSHFDMRVISLNDRRGQLLGKLATWRDISAIKQAEERLRVFFHAVEQNPAAIVITDPEGQIEYVNTQFVRLSGYTLEEVRGQTPRILRSGEMTHERYVELWEKIKAGQTWEGEILNRKKNGELYWAHELIAPVLDDKGTISRFVAMQQDITLIKHTEGELRAANTRLQLQLTEIEALHDQLREEAIRDGLTRLYNRRYMEESLEREVSRAERDSVPISVVMMDVDLFKTINDTYGHHAGDSVLQTLGAMLLENTRISDIACRYGGDETVVVMPGASLEEATRRAEEWRAAFSLMEFTFGDDKMRTTLSLGVATFPDQVRGPVELLTAADKALYWAKIKRNNVCRYDPSTMAQQTYRSDNVR